ncbi:reactivating factor for ethanolamine ammonia lyase [Candidatus Thorarchaeota archaeon]|nr:MAG: reactivating factor for ethanolamine ammonia lyase [Candidatus Thorarchaeota archaeon]
MFVKTDRKELTSIGVDIGSSTSHVVFSKIILEKDIKSRTEKFEIVDKEVIFSGPIHLTPFKDAHTIDYVALQNLLLSDYKAAGMSIGDIDTGAVIITGESAKKQNAEQIVEMLAGEAGKFVAATAGPNFESVLAAHGSGAIALSEESGLTVMNIDIGGGSSNIAICRNGKITDTGAINVGGRLVAFEKDDIITRLEETGRKIGEVIGVDLQLGSRLDDSQKRHLAKTLAEALVDTLTGKPNNPVSEMLLMTEPLPEHNHVDIITFSGGVAEFIYGREKQEYNDIGKELADAIIGLMQEKGLQYQEPAQRIRATVIGAGQFSLRVSGSTTFLSSGIEYPIRNLPAVIPYVEKGTTRRNEVTRALRRAFQRFDLVEGEDPFILTFRDAVRPSYDNLCEFAHGVVNALPNTVRKNEPIMMCFDTDVGNSVGNVMKRETAITNEILAIDEISLEEGDFIDIGEPIIEGVVVPVIVKTLIFDSKQ